MTSQNPFLPLLCTGLLVVCLILPNACQTAPPGPQEKIERYDQGQIKRRVMMVNGKKAGKMTEYYPDGKLRGERYFENDIQTGRSVWYFRRGALKEVQYYVNGLKQGGDTLWYETGEVQFTVDYTDGKRNGLFRKWSKTGETVLEARYALDSLVEVIKGEVHASDAMEIDTTQKLREPTLQDASGG